MRTHIKSDMSALTVILLLCATTSAFAAGAAHGGPGAPSVWASAAKEFLGTSASDLSRVYFTGARGIVTEVFYPTLDNVSTVDLQFLVGDSAGTWVDEEKLQPHIVTQAHKRSLIWDVISTDRDGTWSISKRIFTNPRRNALVERVTFQALAGNVSNYRVYVLHNPSMNNSGAGDTSRSLSRSGNTMLVASEADKASALAVTLPWNNGMVSNGFVGTSDGWTDLLGDIRDKTMDWSYDTAVNGNVAQMGWLDFGGSNAKSISFTVVLGFGATEDEAMDAAIATLGEDLAALEAAYNDEWIAYTNGLKQQGGSADDQYYLAAMVLKSSQDKSNGAMVAGMGTPWGESNGDGNPGGYHLVWPRDLYKFASALINAGDAASADRAVSYLINIQMDQATGRFPQNSFIDGKPYWNGTQMDEQAMPIILAWKLGRKDLWPKIKKTADYIVRNGPWTEQERWEENSGYSPSTIAAEIAGLVCAAHLAKANGDLSSANLYLAAADHWQQNVQNWTYTTNGEHGNGNYYIRITENQNPNDGAPITVKNGGGTHGERWIVDGGFLELVRLGVKSASDPAILETLPEYDAILKQTIAGKGDAWFRYNYDGYGEHNNGSPFDGTGKGRLWPIFTAERGIYEIARTGKGFSGEPYLKALKAFSSDTGMIPEQVWNNSANITGWQVDTPHPHMPGSATGSMQPLNWAMGEYINLLASIHLGRNADLPLVVCARYGCLPDTIAPDSPTQLTEAGKTSSSISLVWTASADDLGVKGYKIFRNGAELGTSPWEIYNDTTVQPETAYTYTVQGYDAAGNLSAASDPLTVTTPARSADFPHAGYKLDYDAMQLIQGALFTLYYRGSVADATQVNLHWGINGWSSITDTPMTRRIDGSWETSIVLPPDATSLDFVFSDAGNRWDNNGSRDWHLEVYGGTVLVAACPAPAAGKQSTITYRGNLAAGATSLTLHWGVNGWQDVQDTPMTSDANEKWSATIVLPTAAHMLNMAFKNQAEQWDNNQGRDFHYSSSR